MGAKGIGMVKAGWPTDSRARRLVGFGGVSVAVVAVVALAAVIFRPASHSAAPAPTQASQSSAVRVSPVRSASSPAPSPAAPGPVAGPIADLSVPLHPWATVTTAVV